MLLTCSAMFACGTPAQPVDGGSVDAGQPDSGVADSGVADAGANDAGPADGGLQDSGALDAGFDAGFDTFITSGPTGTITATSASFSFVSTDSEATFACAFDVRTFADCTSPMAYSGLSTGLHFFTVRATSGDGGIVDSTPAIATFNVEPTGPARIRVVTSNLSSGSNQSYDPGDGVHIIHALQPDVVLMQEFNCTFPRDCVDQATAPNFAFARESGPLIHIPNGIISRFPILNSGVWDDDDTIVSDRNFYWAQLDIPGPDDLYVVSVHLSTSANERNPEALELVDFINANVPAGAYLVLAGDFNTATRGEMCIITLGQVLDVSAPYPADQSDSGFTNEPRTRPDDWVLASAPLQALSVPVVLGSNSFVHGLVFDSRVYTPLSELPGLDGGESGALNMQHMAVVRDFLIPR